MENSEEYNDRYERASNAKNGFFGPMKGLDSAKWHFKRLDNGQFETYVEFDIMKGLTPEMMLWWWNNLDTFTTYNGKDFTGPKVRLYRWWHPFDHIKIEHVKKVVDERGYLKAGTVTKLEEDIGGVFVKLNIDYAHHGQYDWKTTKYRSYTRIFAPKGSQLISIEGVNIDLVEKYDELEKTVFGLFFEVEPDKIKKLNLRYKLPDYIKKLIKSGKYKLYIQKQPGNNIESIALEQNNRLWLIVESGSDKFLVSYYDNEFEVIDLNNLDIYFYMVVSYVLSI